MFLADPRQTEETFAEAGGNEPFSFAAWNASVQERLERAHAEGETMRKIVAAAERSQILVDNTYARQEAIEQAVDRRIKAVQRATGVTLENYARIPPTTSTMAGFIEDPQPDDRREEFHRRLRELQEAFPDKAADIRADVSIEDDARAAAKNAEAELETLLSDPNLSGLGGFTAALAGGFLGSFRDPLQVSLMFAGAGPSTARTVIGRIGQTALREGLLNAGAVALSQPQVQAWREEAGLRSGVMPAVENVGLAFLFGAVVGGGIRGGAELTRPQRQAIERVLDGTATAAETRTALDAVKVKLSDADEAALRQAERELADTGEIDETMAQALRHAEAPANNPPPDIVALYPERPADQVNVIDETARVKLGTTETIDGKPVTFERFDPRTLSTDAATFQYKGGGDAQGVTDRLRNVTQWDPIASGKGIVFERRDGSLVVADGHQRLGLARRLLAQDPKASIAIDGFRFREADGWTAADVRALAAKKNMQEGSGDALDAARILRERPDLLDGKLPITGPMMRSAIALSRLSDEAFGAALNGVIPPGHAAAIGSMVPDPTQHAAIVADLARFKPETEREARLMIGEILASGFRLELQVDMFGTADVKRSLMAERVRVLDRALAELQQNKKLFGTLSQKADTIEAANNQLDRFGNRLKETQAARLVDVLTRLAQRTGPVSDALNRAARSMAEGLKTAKAARQFLDDVEALLAGNDLQALLAEPKLKPSQTVEPGTPESLASAEAAAAERSQPVRENEVSGTGQPEGQNNAPASPVAAFGEFISGQRGASLEELYARAQALQADLVAAGERIAAETGGRFLNPGVKKFDQAVAKITRKGYADASQMTDLARAGFVVNSAADAETVAAALARDFTVLDEGWKVTPWGYVDRKMLIRGGDGTVAEIQIIPAPMYTAKKDRGGHRLYDAARLAAPGPERDDLIAQQQALYAEARAAFGEAFAGILDRSSAPNSGSKALRQSASDMTAPLSPTSRASTADQAAFFDSTANASPDGVSTAGRQSQLTNVRDIDSNMLAAGDESNSAPSLFDALAVSDREDGGDVRFITREAALADAERTASHADLVASCKD